MSVFLLASASSLRNDSGKDVVTVAAFRSHPHRRSRRRSGLNAINGGKYTFNHRPLRCVPQSAVRQVRFQLFLIDFALASVTKCQKYVLDRWRATAAFHRSRQFDSTRNWWQFTQLMISKHKRPTAHDSSKLNIYNRVNGKCPKWKHITASYSFFWRNRRRKLWTLCKLCVFMLAFFFVLFVRVS